MIFSYLFDSIINGIITKISFPYVLSNIIIMLKIIRNTKYIKIILLHYKYIYIQPNIYAIKKCKSYYCFIFKNIYYFFIKKII